MQSKINKLDFNGQKIYIGIDHHLKSWKITIYTQDLMHKQFSMAPSPRQLKNYLDRYFPGGEYLSAYEAGFSGFSTHRKLLEVGKNNTVANATSALTFEFSFLITS